LYPYQVTGAKFLANSRAAYLADVMGLGKTAQAIVGAVHRDAQRIVVLSPASMVGTWLLEIVEWSDWSRAFKVYSYDKYVRNAKVREEVQQFAPDLLICDEGHYMKGLQTKRTRAVLGYLAQRTPATWLLSGTPTPNGPHELWTAFKYLRPDILAAHGIKTYRDWLNKFCAWAPGDYGPRIFGAKNVEFLRSLLYDSGFMLRRTFAEVELELPKLNLQRLQLKGKLTPELEMLLDLISVDAHLEYGELPAESEHVATARRLLGEHKAPLVGAILYDELLNDDSHNVVVFAYHLNVLDTLQNSLQKFGVLRIDGSTPNAKRTELVSIFQKEETHRVFLCQITAGGVGITLTKAKDVVLVEPSWVPGDNVQAIARVRRIGQVADTVTARMAVLSGTLDDPLMGIVARKTIMQSSTIDGQEK
jgi:SNF2 family DNA or RNA helicase